MRIPVCKRTGYEEPWGEVRDVTPLIAESPSCWGRSERDWAVSSLGSYLLGLPHLQGWPLLPLVSLTHFLLRGTVSTQGPPGGTSTLRTSSQPHPEPPQQADGWLFSGPSLMPYLISIRGYEVLYPLLMGAMEPPTSEPGPFLLLSFMYGLYFTS